MATKVPADPDLLRPQPRQRSTHPVLTAMVIIVLALFGARELKGLLPSFHNPFATHTVDRSQPVMLKALTDLHTYDAAHADLQVVVDLNQETDYVPSFLIGKERVFVAAGSVEAGVDFSGLNATTMVVDKHAHSVSITLPHAKLGETTVDPDQSHLATSKEGLLNHIGDLAGGGSGSDAKLYQAAKAKMAAQAAADPSITARAETNTRAMLTAMMTPLGYPNVTVTFG